MKGPPNHSKPPRLPRIATLRILHGAVGCIINYKRSKLLALLEPETVLASNLIRNLKFSVIQGGRAHGRLIADFLDSVYPDHSESLTFKYGLWQMLCAPAQHLDPLENLS